MKLNFTILVVACCMLSFTGLLAQTWEYTPSAGANANSKSSSQIKPPSYYDALMAFDAYWKDKTPGKGSSYKHFRRTQHWLEDRLYPTGYYPESNIEKEYDSYKQMHIKTTKGFTANWTPMGPWGMPKPHFPDWYTAGWGSGRVNCIEFNPTNDNIIWIGFPAGGLWKSTNGGQNWSIVSSFSQSNGISDIVIAPSNPSIMYLASGDADEGSHAPSLGVFKSIDGGANWNYTGLRYNLSEKVKIFKLLVHPTNPNIVVAATMGSNHETCGIQQTSDGGATWTKAWWKENNLSYYGCGWADLEYKPGDPNTVYAARWGCGKSSFFKSTDGGKNFNTAVAFPAEVGRINLAVSAANPNVIYALCHNQNNRAFYAIYRSTDGGTNWTIQNGGSPNILGSKKDGTSTDGQGEYDLSIVVSPDNSNIIYVGGVNQWKSTDGGVTWSIITYWNPFDNGGLAVVHADNHALEISPISKILYNGNDGGIYKSTDGGATYSEINEGINTHLVEKLSDYEGDPGTILFGAQDNSSFILKGGVWSAIGSTGDGADNMIDPNNSDIMYTASQNGTLNKTTDGGKTYQFAIGPNQNGPWITPMRMLPSNSNIIYSGYDRVYKSIDAGKNWTSISGNISDGSREQVDFLNVDKTGNTIYAGTVNHLYRTSDGGSTWTNITAGLPVAKAKISGIYSTSFNGSNIWVTFNGYAAGEKVYFSNNGGSTWANISGTLPNIPMHCVIYDENSSIGATYLGGDYGVFYKDNGTNDWALFNTNLPDIPIMDMEINYASAKLRIGTRGRGVWESPISTTTIVSSSYGPCSYVKFPIKELRSYSYSSGKDGYAAGHNKYGDTEFAEIHTPDNSYTHVTGVGFDFSKALTSAPASAKVTAKMWKNDGPNGAPGTVITQKDVLISSIITNITNHVLTEVKFTTPIVPTGTYYVGYELYYQSGDTVNLWNSLYGSVTTNTAWVKENGVWMDWPTSNGAGKTTALAVYPIVGIKPGAAFTSNATSGGPGTKITFSNNSTNGYAFKWVFTGGNPAEASGQNPTVTYDTPGSYAVKLVAYGTCSLGDSIVKASYITIGAPTLTGVVTNVKCNGGSDGAINIAISGTNNTFLWSNNATTEDISGLVAGTYTVTVTSGSTTATQSFVVIQPALIKITSTQVDVACNGSANGSADITVTGGTAPYIYAWSNGASTEDINGLNAGTYTVTVTATGGCTLTKQIVIDQPAVLTADVINIIDASCGGNTGSIDIGVSGGTIPFTYSWSNGTTTEDASALGAGTYVLTVTDKNNCKATKSVSVSQPSAMSVTTTSVTDATCNGLNNGAINISVSGGAQPYTFNWSNGNTTEDITSVVAGSYVVTVTDGGGCSFNKTIAVGQPAALSITLANKTNVSCFGGSNGYIYVNVSGGNTPYTYKWSNNASGSTRELYNIPAGTYTLTFSDGGGCSTSNEVVITQPAEIVANVKVLTPVSCAGGNNGAIDINASGGAAPLSYYWSNSATTQDISNLTANTYKVTITDNSGCKTNITANVVEPLILSASINGLTHVSCKGGNDGTIDISLNGGNSPFSYSWSNNALVEDLSGLVTGAYAVTITDAKGCKAYANAKVEEPELLTVSVVSQVNPICLGGSNGSADISVTGAKLPYTYNWSNGSSVEDPSGLSAGTYTVTVTATGGCTATKSVTITQPLGIVASLNIATNVSCSGGKDGAISIDVTGGTSPYTYSWSNAASTQNISALAAGQYTVTVNSASGNCPSTFSATLTQPSPISITIVSVSDASCGSNTGAIDIAVNGGTNTFTYNWSNASTTQDIAGLGAGNYAVTVTDGNGCVVTKSATVNQPSALLATVTSITHNLCNAGTSGAINVTVTGGSPSYTFNWSSGQVIEDISSLAAGNYKLTVTDNAACNYILSAVVNEPLVLSAVVDSKLDASCTGSKDGTINLQVTGGTAPYTYEWSNAATTQNLTGLASGTYTVTVTSTGGCFKTVSSTINDGSLIVISSTQANVSCTGGQNGSIDLSVSGGNGGYAYAWSNQSTTQDISNLLAETYIVTVTDSKGCKKSSSIVVQQPQPIQIEVVKITNANCNTNTNGGVDINVSGGTAPYSYMWSVGSEQQDMNNIAAGTYQITVTDSLNCKANKAVTVEIPQSANVTVLNKKDVKCFGDINGSIDIQVDGGIPPYSYEWSSGQKTQDLTGIGKGMYNLLVYSGGGCQKNATVEITEPSAINASVLSKLPVTCNGGNNGQIKLNTSGGDGVFTYKWSNAAITKDIVNLLAGTYTVTVTDGNNCIKTIQDTITQPTLIAIVLTNKVNTTCGQNNGSIDISVTGGKGAYTYKWSSGQLTQDVTGLNAGSYIVTVKDVNACSVLQSYDITQPGTLLVNVNKTDISCNGNTDGKVDLTVSGGTTPYTFVWSNSLTTQNISKLANGIYTVTVSDASNCDFIASANIIEPQPINITVDNITAVSCAEGTNGAISISIAGGSAPYTYKWSNASTTKDLTNLSVGVYTISVTDKNGCISVKTATVTQPQQIAASIISQINTACNGSKDASVNLSVSGGKAPYTYNWSNGETIEDLDKLAAGIYTVTVTDSKTCTATAKAIISQPAPISVSTKNLVNVSCGGGNNGAIDILVQGGTPAYTYLWSNGAMTKDIQQLAAGNYTVSITDAKGCEISNKVTVLQNNAVVITEQITPVTCNAGNTGAINLMLTGGKLPYTYKWSNAETTKDLSSLVEGVFTITVTDSSECISVKSYQVTQPSAISIATASSLNVLCNGGADGMINISVNGGTSPYTYAWSNGKTTEDINQLVAGTYTVTVTDNVACVNTASVVISQPAVLSASVGMIGNSTSCIASDGLVVMSVNGGAPAYTYLWSNAATTQNLTSLSAGTYIVTVTDVNGCKATTSANVGQASTLAVSINSITPVTCNSNADGAIDMTVNGGTPSYTYIWSNSATTQDVNQLTAGTYKVTVTDAGGCKLTRIIDVTQPTPLATSMDINKPVSCSGASDGELNLTVSGGNGSYTYQWSNSATTQNVIALTAGTFTVTVTDAKACNAEVSAVLINPSVIKISELNNQSVKCYGGADGSVNLNVSGGTSPYLYAWSSGKSTQALNNVIKGNYNVTVTDKNGCTNTATISINQSDSISVAQSITQVSSNGGSDALIDLTIGGGTAPYTYLWNTGKSTEDIAGIAAGVYTVTITDSWKCTQVKSYTVTQPSSANYCTGTTTLSSLTSTITDGSGSNTYGTNADCYWLIKPTNAAKIILSFSKFATQTDKDVLTVYDGETTSAPVLDAFSGNNLPYSISSTGGAMLLHFTTDASINDSGWVADYITEELPTTYCTGKVPQTAATGTITDGSGASNYNNYSDCMWLLQPTGATSVKLVLNALDLEEYYDYLTIYDGADTTDPVLTYYTGTALDSIESSGGSILVRFTSDYVNTAGGFSATYTSSTTASTLCSGTVTLTEAYGSVTDGSASAKYSPNSDCNWLIQPIGATSIYLSFYDLNLEDGKDFIKIYDGSTTSDALIGTYTGSTLPADIASSGGSLLIHFTSDNQTQLAGWDVYYYAAFDTVASYCTGLTTLTDASGILSDGSGDNIYTSNASCSWLIEPVGATMITLDFTSFDLEDGYDYLRIYEGSDNSGTMLAEYTGYAIPQSVTTIGSSMFIEFSSDALYNMNGWDAIYTSSTGAASYCSGSTSLTAATGTFNDGSGPNDYLENADCYWLIEPTNASSITLNFKEFDLETTYDSVYVYDGATTNDPVLGAFTGNLLPDEIISTGSSILIHFISDYMTNAKGWTADYIAQIVLPVYCSGTKTVTDVSGTISDGSGTEQYGENANCQWLIQPAGANHVTLNFTEFSTEYGYDYVYVYDGADTTATLLGMFTGSTLPVSISSSTGSMVVQFISDNLYNETGWSATYDTTYIEAVNYCSGSKTVTDSSGTISDGSGTDSYSSYADCYWLIQPANASSISLHFTSFATEVDYDKVYVYDGATESDSLIGIYSGSTIPADIISSSGSLLIHFTSDSYINDAGWEASYTSEIIVPQSFCTGLTTLTTTSGSIADGSGVQDYQANSDCQWLINPSGATAVTLTILSIDVEDGYDFVTVYDGSSTSDAVLGTFTGTTIPSDVTSSGGVMLVVFSSDYLVNAGGFEATYTSSSVSPKPTALFTADKTTVTTGGTVNFTDQSSNSPTSWNWTFEGGTPSTSSNKNPSIVYSTIGIYDVKLVVANAGGKDSILKTVYITVEDAVIVNVTDTTGYPLTGTPSCYTSNGNNDYGDLAKANYFSNTSKYDQIIGLVVDFCYAIDGSGSGVATAAVWDTTGVGESPGASEIATKSIAISSIVNDILLSQSSYFEFTTPVNIVGAYYAGIILPTTTNDTVLLTSNMDGDVMPGLAWEQWSSTNWYSYKDGYNSDIVLAVYPVVSRNVTAVNNKTDNAGITINMFPNPAVEHTTIVSDKLINQIKVYNIVGELVINTIVNSHKYILNTESFTSGVYMVSVEVNGFTEMRKLQIVK